MKPKSKADQSSKQELAYLLYMSGEQQKDIVERVGTSSPTLKGWIEKGGWKEKRAASTITRTELINKTLTRISDILEDGNIDVNADKLTKLASLIEKLDKKGSPVLIMDIFIDFGRWLKMQGLADKEVDIEFVKKVTRYQDQFITQKLGAL